VKSEEEVERFLDSYPTPEDVGCPPYAWGVIDALRWVLGKSGKPLTRIALEPDP